MLAAPGHEHRHAGSLSPEAVDAQWLDEQAGPEGEVSAPLLLDHPRSSRIVAVPREVPRQGSRSLELREGADGVPTWRASSRLLFVGLAAAAATLGAVGIAQHRISVKPARTPGGRFFGHGSESRTGGLDVLDLNADVALAVQVYRTAKDTGERLSRAADVKLEQDFDFSGPVVEVDPAVTDQDIIGFGGALTDAAASLFSKVSPELQEEVLEKYYGESGLGYTIGRVHINSCDFSSGDYAFDDVPGDWSLDHFDHGLTHDKKEIIPLVKRAMRKAEDASRKLRVLASPWSPPAWMKKSGKMDSSSQPCLKDEAHGPWAEYITTWISDMKAAGVPIWALTVQNEPTNNAAWEACMLSAEEEADFIVQHLGPKMRARHGEVVVFAFDDQKDRLADYVTQVMSRPDITKYVDGIAFHWYTGDWFQWVDLMHKKWPKMKMLASEATYERRMWEEGRTEAYPDWRFGEGYAHDIIGDFSAGAMGWVDWNIVLDKHGGPNHVGNVCDAAIILDPETQQLHVHPQYYYIGHFSKFILPGSKRVSSVVKSAKSKYNPGAPPGPYGTCTGEHGLETTAARRPDGQLVVVVLNCAAEGIELKLRLGERAVRATAPARSITTFVLPAEAA